MSKSVLDKDGLLYLWGKVKAAVTDGKDKAIEGAATYTDNRFDAAMSSVNNKVDKVEGKSLSTNDFTDADKSKLDGLTSTPSWDDISGKPDFSTVYQYKGSVATTNELPGGSASAGDVYNVESTGMNYAWTGTGWDALGSIFELTTITNAEIDTITTTGS